MPTAIVLLKIDHKQVTGTAEKILEIRAVTDVYSVSGRFDLLVIIKCDSIDKIEGVKVAEAGRRVSVHFSPQAREAVTEEQHGQALHPVPNE